MEEKLPSIDFRPLKLLSCFLSPAETKTYRKSNSITIFLIALFSTHFQWFYGGIAHFSKVRCRKLANRFVSQIPLRLITAIECSRSALIKSLLNCLLAYAANLPLIQSMQWKDPGQINKENNHHVGDSPCKIKVTLFVYKYALWVWFLTLEFVMKLRRICVIQKTKNVCFEFVDNKNVLLLLNFNFAWYEC